MRALRRARLPLKYVSYGALGLVIRQASRAAGCTPVAVTPLLLAVCFLLLLAVKIPASASSSRRAALFAAWPLQFQRPSS